jgi:hypothetical protein
LARRNIILNLLAILLLLGCGDSGTNVAPGTVLAEALTDDLGNYTMSLQLNSGSFTVTGGVSYEDRIFSHDQGFYGNETKPVRRALVQAVADYQGSYYIRCFASNVIGTLRVMDLDGNVYAYRSSGFSGGTDATVDLHANGQDAEPFNIYDTVTDGFLYVESLTGSSPASPLTLRWGYGNIYGTYYDPAFNVIYVLGHPTDDDGWDDIVLLHELGHHVATEYSRDDSPGGVHYLHLSADKRLVWSEGWASYFALQVMAWRNLTGYTSGYYIDTSGEPGSDNILVMYEVEAPTIPDVAEAPGGDSNEVSVSALLWDITDSPALDDDSLSVSEGTVWDVFTNYIPLKTHVSFETFWDEWKLLYQSQYDLMPLLQERSIEYWEDVHEPSGAIENAVSYPSALFANSTGMHFTYYPSGDKDWVKFQAAQDATYEIRTHNVLGADTYLELYSPGIVNIASNDDIDSCPDQYFEQSCLASEIVLLNAPAAGEYYIRSYTSPLNYYTYGSYDLRICDGVCN